MSKERPLEARTRRGNRIYRNRSVHRGKVHFADQYSFAVKKDGERHRLNVGTHLEDAKALADQVCAFLMIPSHTFADLFAHPDFALIKKPRRYRQRQSAPEAEAPPTERMVPTVAMLLDRYEANAVHLSRTTVKNNLNALRHLAACLLELGVISKAATDRQREQWRDRTGKMRLDEFTFSALESFRTRLIRAAGDNGITRGKVATTLNYYFRCAKSIFSERMMAFYSDFEIPDPLPLRQIKPLREPSRRYHSKIDVARIIQMVRERFWEGVLGEEEEQERQRYLARQTSSTGGCYKSADDFVREDKARFIILLLTIACGLRPKEVSRLTWEQVDFDRRFIHVAVTSYDTPKARTSESSIAVSDAVLEFLQNFRPYSILPPFVLPAFRKGGREPEKPGISLFRGLHGWLRQNGVDCDNPLYTFRKEAGSIIYEQTDSYDRAADFLRNDPRVAREHYVGTRRRLEIAVPGLGNVG